jgi:hypothetical protein
MVLGVDDFTQEFSYLAGRDQWLTRDLLGYGTVCGLRVTAENAGSDGWQIVVGAGAAVNPRGELIRVPAPQCAKLNRWLEAHREEVLQHVGSPLSAARLYVVLCYRDCAVDLIPIPGEPCRSEDDSMAPSRLQDDYLLELRWTPPDQRQEDAIRDFAVWLSQVELADVADSPANRAAFEQAVRQAVPQLRVPPTSPPTSPPDYMLGSPPEALRIPRAAASEYLRHAFRIWTTELRPLWLGINQDCAGTPPDERCVLLAELNIPLTVDGQASDVEPVTVDERRRPYLLSLRMVQEWMLRRLEDAPEPITLAGDAEGPSSATSVVALRGQPIAGPGTAAGQVLRFDGAQWAPTTPSLGPFTLAGDTEGPGGDTKVVGLHKRPIVEPNAGDNGGFLTFNGADWSVTKPGPLTLAGDTEGPGGDTKVVGLHKLPITPPDPVADSGKFLSFTGTGWSVAEPTTGNGPITLVGDAEGPSTTTKVVALQATPVANTPPSNNQFLRFSAGAWRPFTLTTPPAAQQFIVAAGRFKVDGSEVFPSFNNLRARPVPFQTVTLYFLDFIGFDLDRKYIVKGTIVNTSQGLARTIEVVDLTDDPDVNKVREQVDAFNAANPDNKIDMDKSLVVRVSPLADDRLPGIMLEISDFTE